MSLRPPVEPMLARLAREIPVGADLLYEPKWDGFRCIAFRDGDAVDLRSRNQRPLARYFPEIVDALRAVPQSRFIIDGELMVFQADRFDFAAIMARLHPAASRVELLSRMTPATFVAFDLLALGDEVVTDRAFDERRGALERLLAEPPERVCLSPITADPGEAAEWLTRYSGGGIDGVVAKRCTGSYEPGRRVMVKVKLERTADCVVAGFRLAAREPVVSSLLLGLYETTDDVEVLRHVGVAGSFTKARRIELSDHLREFIVPLQGHPWEHGFALEGGPMGRLKGSAGRWTPDLEQDWVPVSPELVCEVSFDQVDGYRFRHPARWRRWRPDRDPLSCRVDQVEQAPAATQAVFDP